MVKNTKAKVNMATKRQTMFPSRCEWEVVNCLNTARIVRVKLD